MELKSKLKGKRLPILGGAVGLLLLVFGGLIPMGGTSKNAANTEREFGFYTDSLEQKIEALVTSISGITDATVLLTLDCSTEYVYAKDTAQTANGYSTDYVFLNGGEEDGAVLLMEIYPKIRGIAVVCTNGNNNTTRQTVVELLSAALGVSANRIKVAGG